MLVSFLVDVVAQPSLCARLKTKRKKKKVMTKKIVNVTSRDTRYFLEIQVARFEQQVDFRPSKSDVITID